MPPPRNTSKYAVTALGQSRCASPRRKMWSNIRVDVRLGAHARVGHRALLGVADALGVFPQRARLIAVLARRPGAAALGQLGVAERDIDRPGDRVDRDPVAVAQQRDRPADRRLGPNMADTETVRRPREPSVGD